MLEKELENKEDFSRKSLAGVMKEAERQKEQLTRDKERLSQELERKDAEFDDIKASFASQEQELDSLRRECSKLRDVCQDLDRNKKNVGVNNDIEVYEWVFFGFSLNFFYRKRSILKLSGSVSRNYQIL